MPKGGFWTANEALCYEPKRQFRFKVEIDGMAFEDDAAGDAYQDGKDLSLMWYIKTVDKPTVQMATFEDGEVTWGSEVSEPQASAPQWQPVAMTMVAPQYPNATRKLMRLLRRAGYLDKKAQAINGVNQFDSTYLKGAVGSVKIHQLDSLGEALETWELIDAWPGEINFGKLDYASEEFVEISVTWVYSYAKLIAYGAKGLDSASGMAMQKKPVLDENGQPVLGSDGKPLMDSYYDGQMNERTFIYQRDGHIPTGKIGTGPPPTPPGGWADYSATPAMYSGVEQATEQPAKPPAGGSSGK